MNYIEITNHAINIDGNYISFDESIIEKTIFFDDRLYVFVKEKDDFNKMFLLLIYKKKKCSGKFKKIPQSSAILKIHTMDFYQNYLQATILSLTSGIVGE